jgi:hypothetical protein
MPALKDWSRRRALICVARARVMVTKSASAGMERSGSKPRWRTGEHDRAGLSRILTRPKRRGSTKAS